MADDKIEKFIYVGDGTAWVMGPVLVPPRDLTADEVERFGGAAELLRSGLYEVKGIRCTQESAMNLDPGEELEDGD